MKTTFAVLRSRGASVKAAVASGLLVAATGAHAALPAWATDIGTDVGEAISDAAALVGPLFAAALVAGLIFKLVKRFTNKV